MPRLDLGRRTMHMISERERVETEELELGRLCRVIAEFSFRNGKAGKQSPNLPSKLQRTVLPPCCNHLPSHPLARCSFELIDWIAGGGCTRSNESVSQSVRRSVSPFCRGVKQTNWSRRGVIAERKRINSTARWRARANSAAIILLLFPR